MIDQSPGRRAAAYWFSDGLPDILFGTMLILFAAAALLWQSLAPHPWIYDLLLITAGYVLHYATEQRVLVYLKSRTTWQRTGYVQPPEEVLPGAGLTTLAIDPAPRNENISHFARRTVQVVFFALYFLFNAAPPRWLAPAAICTLALALYVLNRKTEHPFRAWWAVGFAVSGLIFLRLQIAPQHQALVCCLFTGGWLVVHGLIA
jgi:hypothetical protein